MVAASKFQPFVEALAEGAINFSTDGLGIALANSAPPLTNAALAGVPEVAYTFCSSRSIGPNTSAQTSGTYALSVDDLVLTASGGTVGPFRYVVLYDNTHASDMPVLIWDYGSSITLNDTETLTIDFSANVLTIA